VIFSTEFLSIMHCNLQLIKNIRDVNFVFFQKSISFEKKIDFLSIIEFGIAISLCRLMCHAIRDYALCQHAVIVLHNSHFG